MRHSTPLSGFTLIELSIVLVIIGLIVGGILTGRDLIDAAAQRAQMAQIDKYNTAVNTFRLKYGNLPGDIPDPIATQFGFQVRGTLAGQGDGNGIIESYSTTRGYAIGFFEGTGETAAFWEDLSVAKLLDGNFNTASISSLPGSTVAGSGISNYLPQAKIGQNNYIYVWSGGTGENSGTANNSLNYFGVSVPVQIDTDGTMISNPGITVYQAYNIDKKVDDGLPQSGRVTALYDDWDLPVGSIAWAAGGNPNYGANSGAPNWSSTTAATNAATNTCYDNSNSISSAGVGGQIQHYSLGVGASPNNLNCALSFKFQ